MRGRTEDSVGSQAGEHLLAWPWEGSIILVGWEGVWSYFIWGKVVSATVALFSALGTDGLKASILVLNRNPQKIGKKLVKRNDRPLGVSNHSNNPCFCQKI